MSLDLSRIEGPNLVLRLITPEDATYVHRLRVDPAYNTHLSVVHGTVEDQRNWIESYKTREAVGKELYYIITHHDGRRCGTVRLYNIKEESFTWGSWILDHNKPSKAALESAVLSFSVGFDGLGINLAHVDVRRGNSRAEAFYRRFNMTETHRTGQDIFFVYHRSQFDVDRIGYINLLSLTESA